METRIYRTKVMHAGREINSYIKGRISGAMNAICGSPYDDSTPYASYDIQECDDSGHVIRTISSTFTVKTDAEHYEMFRELMHTWYPNLKFIFDADKK